MPSRGGNSTRCGDWMHFGDDGDERGRNSPRLQAWQAERVSGKSGGDMGLGSTMMNLFLHLLNLR